MRLLIAALALGVSACSADVSTEGEVAAGEGYTLEVRASDAEQTYLVTAPDGRMVAARAAGGQSALMDASGVQALAATPAPESSAPEVMSMSVPGFELSINAEEDDAAGNGSVAVAINADGQRIEVNADEGGAGEGDDRAHVLITGADEAAVRDFIGEAEELSPEVRTQMLAALGLEAVGQQE